MSSLRIGGRELSPLISGESWNGGGGGGNRGSGIVKRKGRIKKRNKDFSSFG